MAIKVVQNVNRITANVSTATTSNPIALKSGYLRVSTGLTSVYVEIGSDPVATTNSFQISPYGSEVLKERLARQKIAGITTGTTTIVSFSENAGNPFLVGDYVTIQNAEPAGINTEHKLVTQVLNDSLTISHNSSSIVGVITTTNANIARSVKVSVIAASDTQNVSISEIVQLVTE
jgi:protein involved in ribonucleotide reduction